jgi:hypothetical protein
MANVARFPSNVLIQAELYDIRSDGRVVRCTLHVPTRTPPQDGAKAGTAMNDWLIANALRPRSGWLGVIMDVRDGPSVLGPVTRSTTERLFEASEQSRRPLAVLVSSSAALFEQFSAMSRRCAPQYSMVTSDPAAALAWINDGPPTPSTRATER